MLIVQCPYRLLCMRHIDQGQRSYERVPGGSVPHVEPVWPRTHAVSYWSAHTLLADIHAGNLSGIARGQHHREPHRGHSSALAGLPLQVVGRHRPLRHADLVCQLCRPAQLLYVGLHISAN